MRFSSPIPGPCNITISKWLLCDCIECIKQNIHSCQTAKSVLAVTPFFMYTQLCIYLQVAVIIQMVVTGTSMRCFLKGSSSSPLVQFSSSSENRDDNGDGGGIPVFTFWSISSFGMFIIASLLLCLL